MPLQRMGHRCGNFPKGYTDLRIEFSKEAISGWNWSLSVKEDTYPHTHPEFWTCYHIKYCPFCGVNLYELEIG